MRKEGESQMMPKSASWAMGRITRTQIGGVREASPEQRSGVEGGARRLGAGPLRIQSEASATCSPGRRPEALGVSTSG